MSADLRLAFADYAAALADDPERTLCDLQALFLDEPTCLARIEYLRAVAETAPGGPLRFSAERSAAAFAPEIRTVGRVGLFPAWRQGLLRPERLAALAADPNALWQLHQALLADDPPAEATAGRSRPAEPPKRVAERAKTSPDRPWPGSVAAAPAPSSAGSWPSTADLGQLATRWSLVLAAPGSGDGAERARAKLLERYHEAVYRYLVARLGDVHRAGEVYSNFAVRVLECHPFLARADPARGRFRDYLKAVLWRMVIDEIRARDSHAPLAQGGDSGVEPAAPPPEPSPSERDEAEFLACWRQEVLNQAWKALEEQERRSGQPYCTAVRLREANPAIRSKALAEQVSAAVGRPFTEAGIRKVVQRGREMFGDLLVAEVARSLQKTPEDAVAAEQVGQELAELGLLFSYTKAALERYRDGGK
jgi:RNA polymerase sigma-70 factor (ECF subfamily)